MRNDHARCSRPEVRREQQVQGMGELCLAGCRVDAFDELAQRALVVEADLEEGTIEPAAQKPVRWAEEQNGNDRGDHRNVA